MFLILQYNLCLSNGNNETGSSEIVTEYSCFIALLCSNRKYLFRCPRWSYLNFKESLKAVAFGVRCSEEDKLFIQNLCYYSGTIGFIWQKRCSIYWKTKNSPVKAPVIAANTFTPCLIAVEMYDLITQKFCAISELLKVPDIFCLTFTMRISRSA